MAEPFPVSGNIDPSAFPFLLADLHRRGATGSLKVEGPAYQKALYFRGGRVLFGSSNDPSDQLGAILIEQGKISQEQLQEVENKVGVGNPLAKVLAESGYVNQRELGEAARIKVERIVSDVIAYASGEFEFEDGVLPKGAVDLKLSTEKLILSAVRHLSDRGFVLRHLQSLAVVLAPTAELQEKLPDLRPETADLPDRLDGRRSLKEAAGLTHLEEFEAAKVACGLLFLGLARRVDAAEATAAGMREGEEIDLSATARMGFAEPPLTETVAIPTPIPDGEPQPFIAGSPPAADASPPSGFPLPESEPATAFPLTPPSTDFPLPEAAPFQPPAAEPPAPEPPASSSGGPGMPEHTEVIGFPALRGEPPVPPEPAAAASAPAAMPSMPPFDEPPAPAVPSRPSKEDLAALDALLNPSASRSGMQPSQSPARSQRWEPQFRPPTMSRARVARKAHGGSPLLALGLATAALLVLGGSGAWYYFNQLRPAGTSQAATRPAASPGPPTPAPPGTLAASPLPTPMPIATTSASPMASLPPPSAPTATPEPALPSPAPSAPPPVAGPAATARGLLQQGSFSAAAEAFAASLKSARGPGFSVQILVACSTETIQKALESVPAEELFILPVDFRGRSCYRICWGLYDSEDRASAALRSLPEYFIRGGANPKVAPVAGLLP